MMPASTSPAPPTSEPVAARVASSAGPRRARHSNHAPLDPLAALRWRTLLTEPLSGAENMALDEALMERARRTGEAVLRIYGWRRPTLSLGRNQWAAGKYDLERAAALGVDIVRRPTGGRAVLHHHEVTYSVTAPTSGSSTLKESYAQLNRLVLDALRLLGVHAEEARRTMPAPAPGIAPCFETPTAGEITANGRKLVGSAQFRERDALLQHGSILVEDDQWLASSLLIEPVAPAPRSATLRALLGRAPEPREVMHAFTAALRAAGGHDLAPLEADILLDQDARRARERYEDPRWTWRR